MNLSDETTDVWPVEHELRLLRRRLEELAASCAADADGSLSEVDAVLRAKRGCRR